MSYRALLISTGLATLLLVGVVFVLIVQDQIAGALAVGLLCGGSIVVIVLVSRHLAQHQ